MFEKMKTETFRDRMKKFVKYRYFEGFITLAIICNTGVLATTHFDATEQFLEITGVLNLIFTGIFTLEAIIKIYALRCDYFFDGWNIFDFVIVVLSLFFLVLTSLDLVTNISSISMVLRTLRIGRIVRLIKRARTLQITF